MPPEVDLKNFYPFIDKEPKFSGAYWVELPTANGNPFWDIWWWVEKEGWEGFPTTIQPLRIFGPIPTPDDLSGKVPKKNVYLKMKAGVEK